MWKSVFAITLGAALGALLRWLLGLKLNALFPTIPPGSLAAKLIGGYVIGSGLALFAALAGLASEAAHALRLVLMLPRRHVANWFETNAEVRIALFELADAAKAWLDREFYPDGYNLGINVGEAAGQTVFHVHLHLIPVIEAMWPPRAAACAA
jgi:hypothetical protein